MRIVFTVIRPHIAAATLLLFVGLLFNTRAKNTIMSSGPAVSPSTTQADELVILKSEQTASGTEAFDSFSIRFKEAEYRYNIAKICKAFAAANNSKAEYTTLTQYLQIDDLPLNTYVSNRKTDGATNEQLISEIKTTIISTIEKTLHEKY
jgi:hypothetical protein